MLNKFKYWLENQTTSTATISARLSDVNIFYKYYNKLNTENVQDFVHRMVKNGLDSKTIARRVSSLKKFAEFNNIVFGKINTPKQKRRVPQILSPAELKILLDKAYSLTYENNGFDALTVQVMIILFNYMIRRQGVLDIKNSDIDFKNKTISIHNKGGDVVVKSIVYGLEKIKEYIDIKNKLEVECEYLLVRKYGNKYSRLKIREMYQMLYAFTEKTIGKKVNPHQFRHSVATGMLDNGADIRLLQDLLNHKDISTTQFYTQVSQKRADDAYNKFHPAFGGTL